jgi:polysaccharide export outer membrane protein
VRDKHRLCGLCVSSEAGGECLSIFREKRMHKECNLFCALISKIVGVKIGKKGCGRIMSSHLFKISWLFLLVIMVPACATTPSVGPQAMQGAMAGEPLTDYRLRPGDEIEIKFFYHPGLNERLVIGPDGKISLQLIDEILVAGLTTSQLDELLTREYDKYLENVNISVIARVYSGLKVYVGGEVGRPGFYSLAGNMTVLQSIFTAQGFRDTAKRENVILVRKGPESRPLAMAIDLGSVISGEQLEHDIYLMPSDIVYVPKTFIAKAGVFVDQYFRRVLFLDSIIIGVGYALGYDWVAGD